jgi:hypothetical protein
VKQQASCGSLSSGGGDEAQSGAVANAFASAPVVGDSGVEGG